MPVFKKRKCQMIVVGFWFVPVLPIAGSREGVAVAPRVAVVVDGEMVHHGVLVRAGQLIQAQYMCLRRKLWTDATTNQFSKQFCATQQKINNPTNCNPAAPRAWLIPFFSQCTKLIHKLILADYFPFPRKLFSLTFRITVNLNPMACCRPKYSHNADGKYLKYFAI